MSDKEVRPLSKKLLSVAKKNVRASEKRDKRRQLKAVLKRVLGHASPHTPDDVDYISAMPHEIIRYIASYLHALDCSALIATCRALRTALSNEAHVDGQIQWTSTNDGYWRGRVESEFDRKLRGGRSWRAKYTLLSKTVCVVCKKQAPHTHVFDDRVRIHEKCCRARPEYMYVV